MFFNEDPIFGPSFSVIPFGVCQHIVYEYSFLNFDMIL